MIISTGRTNWAKEVTDVSGSLAYFLASAQDSLSASSYGDHTSKNGSEGSSWPGFLESKASSRLMILNGSLRTASEDSTHHTVLVLPDFILVNDVPESLEGANDLWHSSLDPSIGRGGAILKNPSSDLKTWPLPYDIVIMICESPTSICVDFCIP